MFVDRRLLFYLLLETLFVLVVGRLKLKCPTTIFGAMSKETIEHRLSCHRPIDLKIDLREEEQPSEGGRLKPQSSEGVSFLVISSEITVNR